MNAMFEKLPHALSIAQMACSPCAAARYLWRSEAVKFVLLFSAVATALSAVLVGHHAAFTLSPLAAEVPVLSQHVLDALASIPTDLRVTLHANASLDVNRRLPTRLQLASATTNRTFAVAVEAPAEPNASAAAITAALRARYDGDASVRVVIAAPYALLRSSRDAFTWTTVVLGHAAVEGIAAIMCHAYDEPGLWTALSEERSAKLEVLRAANGNGAAATALLAKARATADADDLEAISGDVNKRRAAGLTVAPHGLAHAVSRLRALPHYNVSQMRAGAAREAAMSWPELARTSPDASFVAAVRLHNWMRRSLARAERSPTSSVDGRWWSGKTASFHSQENGQRLPSPLRRGGDADGSVAMQARPAAVVSSSGGGSPALTASYVCTRATAAAALEGLFSVSDSPEAADRVLLEGDVLVRFLLLVWLGAYATGALVTTAASLALRVSMTVTALRVIVHLAQPQGRLVAARPRGRRALTLVALAASAVSFAWIKFAPLLEVHIRQGLAYSGGRSSLTAYVARHGLAYLLSLVRPLSAATMTMQVAAHVVATATVMVALKNYIAREVASEGSTDDRSAVGNAADAAGHLHAVGAALDETQQPGGATARVAASATASAAATPNRQRSTQQPPDTICASTGHTRRRKSKQLSSQRAGSADESMHLCSAQLTSVQDALPAATASRVALTAMSGRETAAPVSLVDQLQTVAHLQRSVAAAQLALQAQFRALEAAIALRQSLSYTYYPVGTANALHAPGCAPLAGGASPHT